LTPDARETCGVARTRTAPTARRLVLLDGATSLDGVSSDLASLAGLLGDLGSLELARPTPDILGRSGIASGKPVSLADPTARTTVATTAATLLELEEDELAPLVDWIERGAVLLVLGVLAGTSRSGSHRDTSGHSARATSPASTAAWAGRRGVEREATFGLQSDPPLPVAEWFLRPCPDRVPAWAARLPDEWPFTAQLLPLAVPRGWDVAATVNVAFRDLPVVASRAFGAGRVVRVGLGQLPAAPAGGPLARFLQRAASVPPARDAAPEEVLGVGIVGYGPYGGMGLHHGLACRAVDGLELVAACDPDPARRKSAEADFPGIRTYATATELAADQEVDVAVVATPPSSHFELVVALLEAGKHVACEKPLCFRAAEVDRLDRLAAEADLLLTVHQNRRFDPDFRAVQRAVANGLVGELFNVETFVGTFAHPCRAWHSEASISGGAIYDWGAHYLDWTLLLMPGEVQTVRANAHKRVWHDVTNHDQVRVHLDFTDGREAEFVHSDVAAIPRPKLYLQGTAGTLAGHYRPVVLERLEPGLGYVATEAHHAEAPAVVTLSRYTPGGGLDTSTLPLPAGNPFPFHANLADHLLLGEPVAVALPGVRRVIAVLEAAQASADANGAAQAPACEA
jgi:predicted dehydrogenase